MVRPRWVLFFFLFSFAFLLSLPHAADNFPPGTYRDNSKPIPFGGGCRPIEFTKGRLVAECPNFFGFTVLTSLDDADKCVNEKHDIQNINGTLRCVVSSQRVNSAHPYTADIVSVASDVKNTTYPCLAPPCKPNQETKVIRIDQPRVDVAYHDLKDIEFQPGDNVVITAGGCVHPGASGTPWRSYVAKGSGQNFYGIAWISGTTGEQPKSLADLVGKTFTVPLATNPALRNDVFLQIGYQDAQQNYNESGYWGPDNGENVECKDAGPAWVEVKVNHVFNQLAEVTYSPHSKPFDLVWDINSEDFNGLPVNPEWAYQLNHPEGGLPNFQSTCHAAIISQNDSVLGNTGGTAIDRAALARDCTSQPVYLDLFTGIHWCFGSCLCTGLINGHLNWAIATYTGTIGWDDYAGNWPHDGDYDLSLNSVTGGTMNGFTALNWSDSGEYGLGLEFKGGETLDRTGGPWWQRLDNGRSSNDGPYTVGQEMFNEVYGDGLEGVVIGLIGMDGVHGGYTESHPVFAIAVRTDANQVRDGVDENWVFFLRNFGNEGECSGNIHGWPSARGDNVYYIQLPWWGGATDVKVSGTPQWWAWQEGQTHGSIVRSAEPGWTLIKIRFPSNGQNGVDGQFTLHYTVPAIRNAERAAAEQSRRRPRVKKLEEDGIPDVSQGIADAATKAKFKTDFASLQRFTAEAPGKKIPLSVDTSLAVEQHLAGAASRGALTPTQMSLDPLKKQQNDAMKSLLDNYRSRIQQAPPRQ